MQIFSILNIIIFFQLLLSTGASFYKPNLKKSLSEVSNIKMKKVYYVSLITGIILVGLAFYILASSFLYWYLRITFSILSVLGGYWMGLNQKSLKFLLPALALLVVIWRFIMPSVISHNLLIILSTFWLGSFFFNLKVINLKSIVIISILWALYDLYFVWLSPGYANVDAKTGTVGFPLGLVYEGALIGSGDLIWFSLFIPFIKEKIKFLLPFIFVFINLLVGFFSINTTGFAIPLLVFWVPVGLLFVLKWGVNSS